jgi:hypothetical protein
LPGAGWASSASSARIFGIATADLDVAVTFEHLPAEALL